MPSMGGRGPSEGVPCWEVVEADPRLLAHTNLQGQGQPTPQGHVQGSPQRREGSTGGLGWGGCWRGSAWGREGPRCRDAGGVDVSKGSGRKVHLWAQRSVGQLTVGASPWRSYEGGVACRFDPSATTGSGPQECCPGCKCLSKSLPRVLSSPALVSWLCPRRVPQTALHGRGGAETE